MATPHDIAVMHSFWGKGMPQTFVMAKDINSNPLYIATGPRGVALSSAEWLVEKLTWDADGDYLSSQYSEFNVIANNYLTLEYK